MNLQDLEAFVQVVQCKSVTKAAEQLYVSPSTVTVKIKSLEHAIGFKLFDRLHHEMRITASGRFFYHYALRSLQLSQTLNNNLKPLRSVGRGRLEIASTHTTATYYLPFILKKFRENYPDVVLNVHTSLHLDSLDHVRNGTVELGLLRDTNRLDNDSNHIFLFSDKIIPVFRSAHPLTKLSHISPHHINQYGIVCYAPNSPEWKQIGQWFTDNDVSPNIHMTMNHVEIIKELLVRTDYVALLPRFTVCEELARHTLCTATPAPLLHAERRTYLTFRQEKLLSPTAKAFKHFILQDSILNLIKGS